MKIFFMGTPEFAKIALEALKNDGTHEIVGVAAQPDKPQGRKMILTPPPVKEYALAAGISVYQPETLRSKKFCNKLETISPDIIIVAAYGKILPKNILELPRYGCINIHASILPKYRGASPINAAIREGETQTGVTIIQMDDGIDTGDMLAKAELSIGENENCGELTERLAILGGALTLDVLKDIENSTIRRECQDHTLSSHTSKIETEDCRIDWNMSAERIHNFVRSISPAPCAFTEFGGKNFKIRKTARADAEISVEDMETGKIIIRNKNVYVKTGMGFLQILEVQPFGKNVMTAASFLNGIKDRDRLKFGSI